MKTGWSSSLVQFSRTLWEMNLEGATLAPAAIEGENTKKSLKKKPSRASFLRGSNP
jgi:hypothetical protein